MHAGWLERTDQPSCSAYCQTLCWPLMVLFSLFFVTWLDRSYLNQPRSESDASPNTALRSPSCASSDRRGAKPSLSAVPVVGTDWNKVMFFFTGNPRGGTRGFTAVKQRIKDS